MQGLHPLARSFAVLCIGSALGLAVLEWRASNLQPVYSRSSKEVNTFSTRLSSIFQGRRPLVSQRTPQSDVKIVVQLSKRTIDVYQRGELIKQYLVAVGQTEWETPEGQFSVIQKSNYPAWEHPITGEIVPAGHKNNPLGSHWIGFLSSNDGQIGFHGTNEESLIGEAISHGCIRMLNEDIEDLYTYVEIGTTVTVQR